MIKIFYGMQMTLTVHTHGRYHTA